MTRIMQLSDIEGADAGEWLTPVVCARIDDHLRDYCLGMDASPSDRYVRGISLTPNGYIRVEYRVTGVDLRGRYVLFYLGDGSFFHGPEMHYIEDVHPFHAPLSPQQPATQKWFHCTGKADYDWENQP